MSVTAKQVVYEAASRGLTPLTTAVEQVDALIEQLDAKRRGLEYEHGEVNQQVARITDTMGETYLAGEINVGAELPALHRRTEAIGAALKQLEKRRLVLQRDRLQAQIIDLRSETEAWQAELTRIEMERLPHLQALSQLEGIELDASIVLGMRSGRWLPDLIHGRPAGESAHCELMGPHEVKPDTTGHLLVPTSRRLRDAIQSAEIRIQRIQQQLSPPPADQPRIAAAEMLALHNFHPQPPAPPVPTISVTEKGVHLDALCRAEEEAAKERDRIARGNKMDGQDAVEAARQAAENKRA